MPLSPQERSRRLKGYAAILASAVLTGIRWPLLKDLMSEVSPLQANWLMVLPALVMIVPVYLWHRRGRGIVPAGAPTGWLVLFGVSATAIFYTSNVGTHLTSATTAALVVRVELAIVFVLSYLLLNTRVSTIGWVGTAAMLIGAMQAMGLSFSDVNFQPLGTATLVVAAVLTAMNAIVIKLKFGGIPSELPTVTSCICQTAIFSAVLLGMGRISDTIAAVAIPKVAVESLLAGFLLVWTLLLYYYAMKRIAVWSCRILSLVTPVVAALGDHFWLGSVISRGQLTGLVCVLLGAALVIIASREDTSEQLPPTRGPGGNPLSAESRFPPGPPSAKDS